MMLAGKGIIKPDETPCFSPLRGFHSPRRRFDSARHYRGGGAVRQIEENRSLCFAVDCE
jgi:hypothetical protein